jgi:hypothetical protein
MTRVLEAASHPDSTRTDRLLAAREPGAAADSGDVNDADDDMMYRYCYYYNYTINTITNSIISITCNTDESKSHTSLPVLVLSRYLCTALGQLLRVLTLFLSHYVTQNRKSKGGSASSSSKGSRNRWTTEEVARLYGMLCMPYNNATFTSLIVLCEMQCLYAIMMLIWYTEQR